MNRKIVILITAAVMILSSFTVALNSSTVHPYGSSYNVPLASSGTAHNGDVTIYANGTVSNTSVVQQSGNTYSLLMGINGTLTDLRNGSVLDGKGFTVNGLGTLAVNIYNVTGLTVSNLGIVNSTEGISLLNVSATVLENLSISDYTALSETMINLHYSSNVTVENSNFSFNGTASSNSIGINAYDATSLNVSGNTMTGYTSDEFVYAEYVGTFTSWYNTYLGTGGGNAYYFDYGGNMFLGYNYMNHTSEGIYSYWTQSIWLSHNVIHNDTYALELESMSSVVSLNDNLSNNTYDVYSYENNNVLLQNDNISGASSYGINSEYTVNLTVVASDISNAGTSGVYTEYGGNTTLINDVMNFSTTFSQKAVYAYYTTGAVNLEGDYIYIPDGTGLYLNFAQYISVTNTYINASYNIYSYQYNSILGATINNNTFITMNGDETIYMYYPYYADNIVITNNLITSPNTSWSYSVLYIFDAYYGSYNIVFDNNTVYNSDYPIYVFTYDLYTYGQNLFVRNNTFVNTADTILAYYYYNTVVTGNTIVNVSSYGIYVENDISGPVNISNNVIVNMPGFGSLSDEAIYLYDAYNGNNIISHNYVSVGSGSTGIYAEDNIGVMVYDNVVKNSTTAFDLGSNNYVAFFSNTANASDYGLYSSSNSNFQYYGNKFSNDNYSLSSYSDSIGSIFANTFLDSQANSPGLYFLEISSPNLLTFYHNNFINETTNSTVNNTFSPANGYVAMNAALPVGGNYWSNYTGSAVNGIGTTPMRVYGNITDYYPLAYMWINPTVTFLETGLPTGTQWSVSFGAASQTSTASNIVYSPNSGEHTNVTYSVSHVSGYVASITSGTVYLNGADRLVMVSFIPYTYNITFSESNLPAGTTWSVTLNGTTETSNSSSITFSEPNGTYSYTVGPVRGYSTAAGSVTVSSGPQSVSVKFTKNMYTVTVNEKGLPSGDSWTFTFNGTAHTSTSNVIMIQTVSGTFTASLSGPSGYTASPLSSVTVNNENTSVNVTFSVVQPAPPAKVYTVLVTEKGLAYGAKWTFTLNGNSYTTNLSALAVHVTAGTYTVNATGPSGYTVTLKATTVTVNGNTTLTVTFTSSAHTSGSSASLYEGLEAGVAIGAVVAAIVTMLATGTGIFRNMKKGKGENQ